ncbi:MAG: hypothetical protein Q9195_007659 [Heterodermia aff. obscurata]
MPCPHHETDFKRHPEEQTGYIGMPESWGFRSEVDQMSTGYNPIVELAKETGTPLHRWKESTVLVDSEGHLVSSRDANNALKQVWIILEAAMDHSTKHSASISSAESLYDFFTSWCDQEYRRGRMTGQEVKLILGMSQMWGAYVGDRVEQQSLNNYENIMGRIAALPLAQAHVHLKSVMVSVQASKATPHLVCVTTSDGKQQYFDDIVITTPLGWLKQNKESILDLRPRIAAAIDSISYGRLEKDSRVKLGTVGFGNFSNHTIPDYQGLHRLTSLFGFLRLNGAMISSLGTAATATFRLVLQMLRAM